MYPQMIYSGKKDASLEQGELLENRSHFCLYCSGRIHPTTSSLSLPLQGGGEGGGAINQTAPFSLLFCSRLTAH